MLRKLVVSLLFCPASSSMRLVEVVLPWHKRNVFLKVVGAVSDLLLRSGFLVGFLMDVGARARSQESMVLNLRPGELVQVRTEAEILRTLDEAGTLDGLPFMLEMRAFCGRKFVVLRRVYKLLVEGEAQMKKLRNTVVLAGVVCNGEAHGGCQRFCLLLWREAWLTRAQDKSK